MRLLLDTQVMLWWLLDAPRLRPDTRQLIGGNSCLVSVASVWEVAIKHRLGKLPVAPASFRDHCLQSGGTLLPVLDSHAIETSALPRIHDDPFDRLLIAQARLEGLMAVSADRHWPSYDVSLHRA